MCVCAVVNPNVESALWFVSVCRIYLNSLTRLIQVSVRFLLLFVSRTEPHTHTHTHRLRSQTRNCYNRLSLDLTSPLESVLYVTSINTVAFSSAHVFFRSTVWREHSTNETNRRRRKVQVKGTLCAAQTVQFSNTTQNYRMWVRNEISKRCNERARPPIIIIIRDSYCVLLNCERSNARFRFVVYVRKTQNEINCARSRKAASVWRASHAGFAKLAHSFRGLEFLFFFFSFFSGRILLVCLCARSLSLMCSVSVSVCVHAVRKHYY